MRELFQMLDNSGPIARTAPAPYPIVDCEKMSAQGRRMRAAGAVIRSATWVNAAALVQIEVTSKAGGKITKRKMLFVDLAV